MKLRVLNKIISVSLIIVIVSHFMYLHNVLQNYVLCNGSDGHVAVENVDECAACSNISSFTISAATSQNIYDVDDCVDTRLNENCIDENKFIPKDKINVIVDLTNTWEIITPTENEFKSYNFYAQDLFKENRILKNYITVSLII